MSSSEEPQGAPWVGILAALFGALLLSSKGIFAKVLYARGMDYAAVASLRAIIALPLFWVWGLVASHPLQVLRRYPQAVLLAAAAGFLAYYLGALASFYSLTLIGASLERVLLFSYPAFVLIGRWLFLGSRPTKPIVVAIGVAWFGIFLAMGGIDTHLLSENWVGGIWVLICAITLAGYFMANEVLSREIGSVSFTLFAMSAAAIGLGLHVLIPDEPIAMPSDVTTWSILISMVLAATVAPLYLVAEGVRRVGAQRAAIATTVGPPSTMFLAWWLLGEALRPQQLVGSALVVGAILILELRLRRTEAG